MKRVLGSQGHNGNRCTKSYLFKVKASLARFHRLEIPKGAFRAATNQLFLPYSK